MADIRTYLDYILSKVYGKDVRQAIVDAINQCYVDATAGMAPVITTEQIAGGTKFIVTVGSTSTSFDVMNGISPQVSAASQASDMTDTELIYVYTKDPAESGYITGYWYFFDDYLQNWRSGGEYQSSVPSIDSTLTTAGAGADAKKVGDEISDLKSQIQSSGGVSTTARNLLKTILENALYKTDQSANIDALIVALTPDTPVPLYTITYSLTNVTSSKNDPTITGGESFTCILTADTDYALGTVTVMMGETDITNTSYANGTVSIPLVTGNIVITATATALPVVKWDYTLGRLPSDNDDGISTAISSGSAVTATFDNEKGIYVTGGSTNTQYARFEPTAHTTIKKGYFETIFTIVSMGSSALVSGRLSNGTNGWNVSFVNSQTLSKAIAYYSGNTNTSTGRTCELNREYKLRIDYDENGNNKIYVDDELIYDGNAVSTYYTTASRLYVQGNISAYVKSMKWVIEDE